VVVDDHGLDEQVLAREEELAAGLRSGDRRRRHQLGDLPDRVRADAVVVEVLGHGQIALLVARSRFPEILSWAVQPRLHN
jgi:hypothetical protein